MNKWDDFKWLLTETILDAQEWIDEQRPLWASLQEEIKHDNRTIKAWRERPWICWLFPGYWRYRLPPDLKLYIKMLGLREVLKYIRVYWCQKVRFLDSGNFVTDGESYTEIYLSNDGGFTWKVLSNEPTT